MAWEENSCISLNMQLIAILSRIGVDLFSSRIFKAASGKLSTNASAFFRTRGLSEKEQDNKSNAKIK